MSFSKVVFCLLISRLVIFDLAVTASFAAESSNGPVSRSIKLKANHDIEPQKPLASHELVAAAGLDRKKLANPLLSGEKYFNEGNYPAALAAYEAALGQYADLVEKPYASVKSTGQRVGSFFLGMFCGALSSSLMLDPVEFADTFTGGKTASMNELLDRQGGVLVNVPLFNLSSPDAMSTRAG